MPRATDITEGMKRAAATAIANSVTDDLLSETCIMPSVFDRSVSIAVAAAVQAAAIADGVARTGHFRGQHTDSGAPSG